MANIELASAFVTITPSLRGAAKKISADLGGVDVSGAGTKIGTSLARPMGTTLKSALSDAITQDSRIALEAQSRATDVLSGAERNLASSRATQQQSQAKVTRAEEKLNELKKSGKATAGQLETAEADLAKAKANLAEQNIKVSNAEDALVTAKNDSTAASGRYQAALAKEDTWGHKLQATTQVVGDKLISTGNSVKNFGGRVTDVGKDISKLTAPATIAATAIGGIAIASGWKRLVSIDTARGQLKGLGFDADAVMKQVDVGVTNTSLSMQEGAGIAVAALSTNNLALEEVDAQIKRVANTSAAYNVDAEHAGNLLNNVLVKNKVEWGDLSQMQQNQIPIVSLLADHYGVAGDEIMKMAQDGKISIDDFNQALDKGAGAAAEEYANTWAGVTANIWANVSKLGAQMLEDVFPKIKDEAVSLLDALKSEEAKVLAANIGEFISGAFNLVSGAIKGVIGWFSNLSPGMQKVVVGFTALVLAAGPLLIALGTFISSVGTILVAGGHFIKFLGLAANAFKLLNLSFMMSPIGLIITAVAALTAGLIWFFTQTDLGREIWGGFVNWLKELWQGVQEFFSDFWPNLVNFATMQWTLFKTKLVAIGVSIAAWWNNLWSGIRSFFSGLWTSLVTWAVSKFQGLRTGIANIGNAIRNWWNNLWSGIRTYFTNIWNNLVSWGQNKLRSYQRGITNIGNGIRNWWNNLWSNIGNFFRNIWSNIVNAGAGFMNGVRNSFMNVINFVASIPSRIMSFFSNAGSWLLNSGKNLLIGFTNGIINGFNNAVRAVSNGIKRIRNFFPFSPAKEGPFSGRGWVDRSGDALGKTFTESVADALHDGAKDVEDELLGMHRQFNDFEDFQVGATMPSMALSGAGVGSGGDANRELMGTLYLSNGAFLGEVRGAFKDPSVTRAASEGLAAQSSRDVRGTRGR